MAITREMHEATRSKGAWDKYTAQETDSVGELQLQIAALEARIVRLEAALGTDSGEEYDSEEAEAVSATEARNQALAQAGMTLDQLN